MLDHKTCEKSYFPAPMRIAGRMVKIKALHPAICRKCDDLKKCSAGESIGLFIKGKMI